MALVRTGAVLVAGLLLLASAGCAAAVDSLPAR
jgi:hypothetical protein